MIEDSPNPQVFIFNEHPKSFIEYVGTQMGCRAEISFMKDKNGKEKENEIYEIDNFIAVKGIKTIGNQFVKGKIKNIHIIIPDPVIEQEEQEESLPEIPEGGMIEDMFENI